MNKDIKLDKVAKYWNRHPVHSVEFKDYADIKGFCDSVDKQRWAENERWAADKFYGFKGTDKTRVLDAGCGVGFFSRFYARKGFELHAIDISEKAVMITKKSFEVFGLKGTIKIASVESIPYEDNYFDYIVSNGVIHHTVDTEKAVEEFYRVLKPGGLASVCVYFKNILLNEPFFTLLKLIVPAMLKKEKLDGRENVFTARTPEDFARVFDGNYTPIAKLYTRKQADELFGRFNIVVAEPHYFPVRFCRFFKTGGFAHKILDKWCGFLIYYLLKKPEDMAQ